MIYVPVFYGFDIEDTASTMATRDVKQASNLQEANREGTAGDVNLWKLWSMSELEHSEKQALIAARFDDEVSCRRSLDLGRRLLVNYLVFYRLCG